MHQGESGKEPHVSSDGHTIAFRKIIHSLSYIGSVRGTPVKRLFLGKDPLFNSGSGIHLLVFVCLSKWWRLGRFLAETNVRECGSFTPDVHSEKIIFPRNHPPGGEVRTFWNSPLYPFSIGVVVHFIRGDLYDLPIGLGYESCFINRSLFMKKGRYRCAFISKGDGKIYVFSPDAVRRLEEKRTLCCFNETDLFPSNFPETMSKEKALLRDVNSSERIPYNESIVLDSFSREQVWSLIDSQHEQSIITFFEALRRNGINMLNENIRDTVRMFIRLPRLDRRGCSPHEGRIAVLRTQKRAMRDFLVNTVVFAGRRSGITVLTSRVCTNCPFRKSGEMCSLLPWMINDLGEKSVSEVRLGATLFTEMRVKNSFLFHIHLLSPSS